MLTRSQNTDLQETFAYPVTLVTAIAATTVLPIQIMPFNFKIDSLDVSALGGYVQDAANYFVATVKVGATVLATYSLLTGQQGTLTAGVMRQGVLSATPSGVLGAQLDLVLTKVGTAANFPAGSRFVVKGRLL